MFDFSVFPIAFRMGAQVWSSKFHNLSYWTPILKWDTLLDPDLDVWYQLDSDLDVGYLSRFYNLRSLIPI